MSGITGTRAKSGAHRHPSILFAAWICQGSGGVSEKKPPDSDVFQGAMEERMRSKVVRLLRWWLPTLAGISVFCDGQLWPMGASGLGATHPAR